MFSIACVMIRPTGFTRVSGNVVVWAGFYWIGRILRCDWAGNCQSHLDTGFGLIPAPLYRRGGTSGDCRQERRTIVSTTTL